MDCQNMVYRLNRIYRLYRIAQDNNRPYRLAQARKILEEALNQAAQQFEIVKLDSIMAIDALLNPEESAKLRKIIDKKNTAYSNGDYEAAAHCRDQEIKYLNDHLSSMGHSPSHKFYCINNTILYR